ncbi:unnamed protein product [Rotaria sp. Silwood2]|nr:unnamed protein product [Rotaria sp. Silwood2]
MGNFVVVPSFHRRVKILNGDVDEISINSQATTVECKNYRVYYDATSNIESSLWLDIKNRKKHKSQTNRIRTTRYNILTFIPKNLFEQFHRVANIYFAALIALNWVPVINAVSKAVAFIPLTVILVITGIKDLVEDLKRWRSDININKQITEVYDKTSRTFVQCKWEDLSVGSIVRVHVNETVPADILLLSSTSCESTCYLDTAAIDGETNLKQKSIPSCFLNLSKPEDANFELQCDLPNEDIYHFHGRITLSSETNVYPCDNNNILLRGCVLRITDYVDGIIVYAGNQTKVIKSSKKTSSKHSRIERHINRDVLFSSVILLFLCLLGAGLSLRMERSFGDNWIYVPFILDNPFQNAAGHFFASALRFMILYQVMVPIALYVSLDIVRVLQMYRIGRDKNLKYEHPISCRTFTINEDLGQIGYIFSDKTGTITQNKLIFRTVSIGGLQYSNRSELPNEYNPLIHHFLTALAICNTSFIVHEQRELMYRLDYQPKYEGDNADDLVLCQAASNFGFRMISRSAKTIVVRYINSTDTQKEDIEYEILCLLPFDSSRRRMSIIVRTNNKIYLYIKGAETSILPNLDDLNDWNLKAVTEQHTLDFAEQGYRSLLVAYREISLENFETWFEQYQNAANSLENHEEAIAEAANGIEINLMLAGLTAVEDKLQDGVPKAIATLRCAGIKIWLVTGDKQATALSTAQAASLVNMTQTVNLDHDSLSENNAPAMTTWDFSETAQAQLKQRTHMIYFSSQLNETDQQLDVQHQSIMDEIRTSETIARINEDIAAQTLPVCLVVTGDDLNLILRYRRKEFIRVAGQCQSVIFCRVSATQKRELVTTATSVFKHRILAIGDGANDVGMIRESHCGVAVYGREGSQAVAAGDFAVDRFECLLCLLLVHGAWCFTRTSELILYTFMHNCQFVFVIFYYQLFNGYSGIACLHSFYLILYTSLFCVLPQCAAALFDEHISAERALREPELYQYTLNGKSYQIHSYWINFFDAVWQSTIIFFISYYSYQHQSDIDVLSFGFSLTFSMMTTSLLHILIQTSRIDWSVISSTILSFLVFLVFTLIFDAVCVACTVFENPYRVSFQTFRQGRFWFTNLFILITALLPRFSVKCIYNTIRNPLRTSSSLDKSHPSSPIIPFIQSQKEKPLFISDKNIFKLEKLSFIRKIQDARRETEEKAREEQRLQEELERLEEEHREKKSIQQQRQEGLNLSRKQRNKCRHTQICIGETNIQIPTHPVSQSATSNNDKSNRKGILYDDRRKINKTYNNNDHQIQVNTHLTTSQESSESDSIDNDKDENDQSLSTMERVRRRLEQYHELCESHRSVEVLRAPVICVLGHVDAGKTTILDNLRETHVQDNEAGGITQQIGATNVPLETIYKRTKLYRKMISRQGDFIVPGLLIIDTPGHETFKNLRLSGSSLCDLAILVVDIMYGLGPQTIESIQLLTNKQTPFIIALNKIDLLYDWKSNNTENIELTLQQQSQITKNHFEKRCNDIICQFAKQHLNVALYYKNPDPNEFYSMVPTSARSGDGMGSLIALIIEKCQTALTKRLSYTDELQATVMEVKSNDGHGTAIDIVLVNGYLSVGDKIVIAGQEGPIVTQIRRLLIPESNQELRVTNQYQTHEKIKGTRGIKILAADLEKSMAGLPLFVPRQTDEIDYFKNEIKMILTTLRNSIQLKEKGVYVQASALGSLEGFLQLLKTYSIPYSGINIGPVHRKDVIRASTQLEKDPQFATILAFDVKIEKDAQEYANAIDVYFFFVIYAGVKILWHDEIYRLYNMFVSYQEQIKKDNQEQHRHLAIFPCKLKILPHYVFNKRDPIICGVLVEDGCIKLGTPICVPSKDCIDLGRVVSIEMNHKSLDMARKGSEVCIKIESTTSETPKMYGRHFDKDDILMSKISRESIDVLKAYFRDEMQKKDWELIIELKKIFNII